jgi:hypothetical protein
MEHAEHRSRAIFARSATASPHLHLRARISNRHFLVRLENAATDRKQTPEANSNRHFWEGAGSKSYQAAFIGVHIMRGII